MILSWPILANEGYPIIGKRYSLEEKYVSPAGRNGRYKCDTEITCSLQSNTQHAQHSEQRQLLLL